MRCTIHLLDFRNRGEAGIYVAAEEKPEEIREKMRNYGINIDELVREDMLQVISYENWYIKEGRTNPKYIISLWTRKLNESLKRGFKCLRATGEMPCFFKHNLIKELIEYENLSIENLN